MIRIQPQVVLWPGQAAGGRPQRRRQRSGLSHGNHCQCDRQAAAAAVRRWHPLAVAAAGAAAAASGGSSLGLLSNQLGVTASPCVNLKGVKMMATRLQVQLLRFPVNHALWQVTSTEKNSHGWLCEVRPGRDWSRPGCGRPRRNPGRGPTTDAQPRGCRLRHLV
jgi:hypothetical protein